MKEWLTVADPASWLALARDAHRFAAAKQD
jgi:hypothetical protein